MGTPWDRAATKYLDEWVPRFVPYHLDLVQELTLMQGQRVLVVSAGLGAEVLALARAVGDKGVVRATDPSEDLVGMCQEQVSKAGFAGVTCERAEPDDVGAGGWHAIVCAFGLWSVKDRVSLMKAWASALVPTGKVGVLIFGPPDQEDPFELLAQSLRELEPDAVATPARIDSDRESMARMFEDGGLSLVRHTVLRHTLTFPSAEAFIAAIREGRTWRRVWQELGDERMGLVTARFYDRVGGPTEPMTFEPAVTCAIAALPGAEVELATRSRVTVPPLSSASAVPNPEPSKPQVDPYKDDPFRD
ncbi:MAG: class I SAM-dependent methyltransferase [Labilithrix sp.]|nr:class I SAM-dependent methyltransferase [Labilithrix sp.]MCW5813081.1 class I SAM-dependent methyltransferase [Labilithrix sp.]